MVACAHLKTLTRKEVESLSIAKKGWQKTSLESSRIASEAKLLKEEQLKQNLRLSNPNLDDQLKAIPSLSNHAPVNFKVKKEVKNKPKTFLEMEKKLVSLATFEEKFMYALSI